LPERGPNSLPKGKVLVVAEDVLVKEQLTAFWFENVCAKPFYRFFPVRYAAECENGDDSIDAMGTA
jgi:hypothetical protein